MIVIATMVHITMVLSVVFNVVVYHVTTVISEAVILNLCVTKVTIFYFCKSDESPPDYSVQTVTYTHYCASTPWYPVDRTAVWYPGAHNKTWSTFSTSNSII